MKFLLCVLFIFTVVYKIKAYPLFEYDIYPSILVHEEHNNVGSESRQVNVPADIYDIVNHIIEVRLKDVLNNGQINSNGNEMEIIIVPPSGQGMVNPDSMENVGNMENPDVGNMENPDVGNMENPDVGNMENQGEENPPPVETTTLPPNNNEIISETSTTEQASTEKPIDTPPTTIKAPDTTIQPTTTTESIPNETTPNETTPNETTPNEAGTTILPQTLPFEIITTETNVPETTTNEITTTEMEPMNVPRVGSVDDEEELTQKEDFNQDVEVFNSDEEKRGVKSFSDKQIKNGDQVMAGSELRELIKLITFDSRFLRKRS